MAVVLGRRNCGALSPKRTGDGELMSQGSTEEAVVIIKLAAEDVTVTLLRIKQRVRDKEVEVKGGTC